MEWTALILSIFLALALFRLVATWIRLPVSHRQFLIAKPMPMFQDERMVDDYRKWLRRENKKDAIDYGQNKLFRMVKNSEITPDAITEKLVQWGVVGAHFPQGHYNFDRPQLKNFKPLSNLDIVTGHIVCVLSRDESRPSCPPLSKLRSWIQSWLAKKKIQNVFLVEPARWNQWMAE